jgi:signal transduction histidine kinase/DNA-binding response OmpR family regulator
MTVINILIIFGCYTIEKLFPDFIVRFTSDFQRYVDHIQTILVSGLFIGALFKYHARIYEAEKNKAEAATKAKADFLANVSHEIRTPLNAIIGLGELELGKNLADETHSNLEKMHNSGMVLLSIINDLLDISKIEAGHFELIPVEYHTPSLLNDTINLNMVRIGSKPITFKVEVDENLPSKLIGDEIRVRQILNNLLSNAFKYTKEGTVRLIIKFEADTEKTDGAESVWFICTVKDSGIGIRKEDIEKLFTVYNQVDTRSNRHIEGTGLGLSICRNLVELMGGTVSVESEYGKGSSFTVRIKQGIADKTPVGKTITENLANFSFNMKKQNRRKLTRNLMPYARVLVVDDVSTNLDVAKGMMMAYDMVIDCVASGREAITLIQEEKIKYDAIFMDHMMPEMDGIEAVRIIRNEINSAYAKNIPIIALTANAIIGNDKMFLENGFQDFLTKPIDMTKLDACLNRWVRNKEKETSSEWSQVINQTLGAKRQDLWQNDTAAKTTEAPTGVKISGIDFAEGVRRMGNREAAYIHILTSYAANLPTLLTKVRNFSTENINDYTITVHGIKGASYGICANELGKQAEALEMAAKQTDIEAILAKNDGFILNAEKLIVDISKYITSL